MANYDTCACDADPDPCCGLEGSVLSCCQGGLTCGDCEVANYNTCACEYDTACCPEFNGCDGCTSETTDQNGCPVCSEDQSITVFGGSCCLDEVTCCPLTDSGCTPSCEPSSSCDECTEGDLVQVAIGDGNNIIGSGGGTVVTDGAVYCCLTSSMAGCGACSPVYHVPGETTASCEGCPTGLYERDNGLWIDCVECTQDSHCDTNNCEACVSNQCQSKCETGQTCVNGSCCKNDQVCGSVCCSEGQFCCNNACRMISDALDCEKGYDYDKCRCPSCGAGQTECGDDCCDSEEQICGSDGQCCEKLTQSDCDITCQDLSTNENGCPVCINGCGEKMKCVDQTCTSCTMEDFFNGVCEYTGTGSCSDCHT